MATVGVKGLGSCHHHLIHVSCDTNTTVTVDISRMRAVSISRACVTAILWLEQSRAVKNRVADECAVNHAWWGAVLSFRLAQYTRSDAESNSFEHEPHSSQRCGLSNRRGVAASRGSDAASVTARSRVQSQLDLILVNYMPTHSLKMMSLCNAYPLRPPWMRNGLGLNPSIFSNALFGHPPKFGSFGFGVEIAAWQSIGLCLALGYTYMWSWSIFYRTIMPHS